MCLLMCLSADAPVVQFGVWVWVWVWSSGVEFLLVAKGVFTAYVSGLHVWAARPCVVRLRVVVAAVVSSGTHHIHPSQ